MNATQKTMLALFVSGVRGQPPSGLDAALLPDVLALASKHNVLPVVFLSIKKLYAANELPLDAQVYDVLNQLVLRTVLQSESRLTAVHGVLRALEDAGISCCVLKGESYAHLYASPSSRISSDVDILIHPSDEERALAVLRGLSMQISPRSNLSHHIRCTGNDTGLIELHTDLYEEFLDAVYFQNLVRQTEPVQSLRLDETTSIPILGINDGALFGTAHFIKHFLTFGAGIKQVMDLLLYLANYRDKMDMAAYWDVLKALKYDRFMRTIMGIGVSYLHFSVKDFPEAEQNSSVEPLLDDILEGGAFGVNQAERSGFHNLYMQERYRTLCGGDYRIYLNRQRKKGAKKSLCLSRSALNAQYPFAARHPILLPAAWIAHTIQWTKKALKRLPTFLHTKKPLQKPNQAVQKRMELIKNLDML